MIQLKIENFSSLQDIKKQLTALEDNEDFKWLMPIINFTLDESVIIYLNNHEPDSSKFNTLDLGEHITEATNLINNCIAKRNEIFEIESQAISSAIEYVQILNTLSDDKKINDLNLLAVFNLSKETEIDTFEKALESKFENINFILRTKLGIHNQKGNPLNYGERTKYLRKIYADNIKNIYERLVAIKRTLRYSFNQETGALPNYIEVSNNLDKLVWWMRDTVYKYEKLEQSDYLIQKSISLSNYAISKGLNPLEFCNKFRNEGVIEINISEQDFVLSGIYEKVRILGVAANVIGYFGLVNERLPATFGEQLVDAQWMVNNPQYMQLQNGINSNINNSRYYENAVKTNKDTIRENLLYYCEAVPPVQIPRLDLDLLYENTNEEEAEFISTINKIDKSKILKDVIDKIEDISIDLNGKIVAKYKPKTNVGDNVQLPQKLVFGELQPIHISTINSNSYFSTENSIKNATPGGTWKIYLSNVSFDPILKNSKLENVKDFVLTFKLSIRKL